MNLHNHLDSCHDLECTIHNYDWVYPRYQVDGLMGDHLLDEIRESLQQKEHGIESRNLKTIRVLCRFHQVAAMVEDDHGTYLGMIDQAGQFCPKRTEIS